MATVGKKGDGHREGAVKKRAQVLNPVTGRYTKVDTKSGKFIDQKADMKPFKGVTKKKPATKKAVKAVAKKAPVKKKAAKKK
jgi:hypothetical protein